MNISLFCPFTLGPTRGNITSVRRIARNLESRGLHVSLIGLDTTESSGLQKLLAEHPPDILHGFHAFHSGPAIRDAARQAGVPYLITITGSDLFEPALREHPLTRQAVEDATAVICFDALVADLTKKTFNLPEAKLHVIPQGAEAFEITGNIHKDTDLFNILLPAAIRPVKGIDFAIEQLLPLADTMPQIRLLVAGGTLDTVYADKINIMADRHKWVSILGDVPFDKMGDLYQTADLVLNSSLFEGGMANALLEAMAMGKPVIARDIPGNRSIIRHGETGWLFSDGAELRQQITCAIRQPAILKLAGAAARQLVSERFSPLQEAAALEKLYRNTCSARQFR